jgi:hypothetical protein
VQRVMQPSRWLSKGVPPGAGPAPQRACSRFWLSCRVCAAPSARQARCGARALAGRALAHGRVHALAHRDGNHGRLAGAGLRLRNDVPALRDGHDGPLLDGRRLLKAELVDAAHEQVLQPHVVKGLHDPDALARLEREALLCIVVTIRRGAGRRPARRRASCRQVPGAGADEGTLMAAHAHLACAMVACVKGAAAPERKAPAARAWDQKRVGH